MGWVTARTGYNKLTNGLRAAASGAFICWHPSLYTVHMLKCMVRGRVCCPLIHDSPFHFISYSCLLRYSWVSPRLIEDKSYQWLVQPTPKLYIPLEIPEGQDWRQAEWKERLIVGHSIGYDRSFIKEQYYIKVWLLSLLCFQLDRFRWLFNHELSVPLGLSKVSIILKGKWRQKQD